MCNIKYIVSYFATMYSTVLKYIDMFDISQDMIEAIIITILFHTEGYNECMIVLEQLVD